jgi:putative nucleotidyltransferase with HDIG domain
MDRQYILNNIRNDSNLLPLPQVISKLLEITDSEDYSTEELADIILKDSSLTAKVLQLSNSSFYNRGSRINNIQQAISIIGAKTVKCLALSTSVLNVKRVSSETGINAQDFFTYILSVATIAESIAKIINYKSLEEALIAGLLHDIGIIYLLNNYGREYGEVVEKRNNGACVVESEKEIFGIDHCELGYNLAMSWKLPDKIARAIAEHHDIENLDEKEVLSNIVKLSILLTFDAFSNSEEDIEKRLLKIDALSKILNISPSQVAEINKKLISRMVEISEVMGVEINDTETLLTRANREIWDSYLTIEKLFKEREELNKKIIFQERINAAMEAKDEALSTLSHYLNNAVMVISGQWQLIGMLKEQNKIENLLEQIPNSAEKIFKSIKKINAVMEVLKEISPDKNEEYFSYSKALNIDDRISQKLNKMGIS